MSKNSLQYIVLQNWENKSCTKLKGVGHYFHNNGYNLSSLSDIIGLIARIIATTVVKFLKSLLPVNTYHCSSYLIFNDTPPPTHPSTNPRKLRITHKGKKAQKLNGFIDECSFSRTSLHCLRDS